MLAIAPRWDATARLFQIRGGTSVEPEADSTTDGPKPGASPEDPRPAGSLHRRLPAAHLRGRRRTGAGAGTRPGRPEEAAAGRVGRPGKPPTARSAGSGSIADPVRSVGGPRWMGMGSRYLSVSRHGSDQPRNLSRGLFEGARSNGSSGIQSGPQIHNPCLLAARETANLEEWG